MRKIEFEHRKKKKKKEFVFLTKFPAKAEAGRSPFENDSYRENVPQFKICLLPHNQIRFKHTLGQESLQ